MTDTPAMRDVINRNFARVGRIDVVVSNAGYGLFGAAEELSDEQVNQIIATNLVAPIQLIRAVLPHLRGQGVGASSRSRRTVARSPSPATRCTTRRNGALKGLWSPSRRRSLPSASA